MTHAPLLLFFITFFALGGPAWGLQEGNPVLLRWNVPEGKAIGFKAAILQAGPGGSGTMEFDVSGLAELAGVPPPSKEAREKIRTFFEGFKLPKEFGLTAILKRPGTGDLSFLMVMGKMPGVETPIPQMTEFLKKMEGGVQLRGQIDDRGEITSFWTAPAQKNLLALFCELPKDRVKVGDRWPIQVNLIQMGHGFIAEKSRRVNRVELSALEKGEGGEVVAVLDYAIAESVEGAFQMGEQPKPTTMSISFAGRARFSVSQGRWKSFAGRMKTSATGIMVSSSDQELALEPLGAIPEELLKLK